MAFRILQKNPAKRRERKAGLFSSKIHPCGFDDHIKINELSKDEVSNLTTFEKLSDRHMVDVKRAYTDFC